MVQCEPCGHQRIGLEILMSGRLGAKVSVATGPGLKVKISSDFRQCFEVFGHHHTILWQDFFVKRTRKIGRRSAQRHACVDRDYSRRWKARPRSNNRLVGSEHISVGVTREQDEDLSVWV